MRRVNKNGN